MIEFILNHDLVQLDDIQTDMTLLDFLRLDKKLKGTKEGCASGDCGACTVVIAEPDNLASSLNYKSLNSCICLLGSIHGKQVITVDALRQDDELHPVQQAIVDEHGSQCGFCTPGFVMSLFALSKQISATKSTPDRSEVVENIDGNLCRCTGYRPIIDAGLSILNQSFTDSFDSKREETVVTLKAIENAEASNFFIPKTIESLANFTNENPDAKLLAGGTDLGLDVTQGLQQFEKVIYLGQVIALKQISETNENIVIGAGVTYQESTDRLVQEYPTLHDHFDRFASTQIRNVGTIGGNVANASPIGDMPPVLVALDSSLVLHKNGNERTVKIDDFYTGYKQTVLQQGEFLKEILIPKNKPNHTLHVYKISKRHADDISAICAAFYIQTDASQTNNKEDLKVESIRIGMGGMAATTKRASNCEEYLVGQLLNRKTLDEAKQKIATDFEPMTDVRATRDYRLLMTQNLLERLFLEQGAIL